MTGSCGFIGFHTCSRLLDDGWQVVGFDDLSRAGSERHCEELSSRTGFTFVKGDVTHSDAIASAFGVGVPDVVVHLAAQVAVTTSISSPRRDFEINALGTLNVLEACRRVSPLPFVIFSSTNKVYGPLHSMAFREGDHRYVLPDGWAGVNEAYPLDFYSPYGCSKGSADQYVIDFDRIFGVPGVVLRQSCIYGPKQMGIEDQGWVAWFAIAALQGREITVFGNGLQVRDLLHVSDLVDLYVTAWEQRECVRGRAFNVGGGRTNALGLLEYLSWLKDQGLEPEVSYSAARPGDQRVFVSDNSSITRCIGWVPRIAVRDGLAEMLKDLRGAVGRGDMGAG